MIDTKLPVLVTYSLLIIQTEKPHNVNLSKLLWSRNRVCNPLFTAFCKISLFYLPATIFFFFNEFLDPTRLKGKKKTLAVLVRRIYIWSKVLTLNPDSCQCPLWHYKMLICKTVHYSRHYLKSKSWQKDISVLVVKNLQSKIPDIKIIDQATKHF